MVKTRENTPHIGIFGRRNMGKSSLINHVAGQQVAIVSDIPGTTTDPVKKVFELVGAGPVVFIDTAGIDDTGELGHKRIEKTKEILRHIDLGIIVTSHNQWGTFEERLLTDLTEADVPLLVVHNKEDLAPLDPALSGALTARGLEIIGYSCMAEGTENLIDAIRRHLPASAWQKPVLIGDLISQGDLVVLVTPIDIEAPEGRLILPQVQVIRDVLDHDGVAIVLKERELDSFFRHRKLTPALVVTDSQVFPKVDASVPKDIPLTSFSIVLARQKGDFGAYIEGTPHISKLRDGDRVLLLESCAHHVSCDDIGRVKIPRWIRQFTGRAIEFDMVAGLSKIDRPMEDYALIIQCGGCMVTRRQLLNRLKPATGKHIPVTNYGMAIAWVHGIFERAVRPFTGEMLSDSVYL